MAAVKQRALSGGERPSAAQVYQETTRVRDRRIDHERAAREALDYQPSAEERERGLAALRAISESIGRKL
jgi:hypothetical protein